MEALKDAIDGYVRQPEICRQHITRAFDKVQPSVREKVSNLVTYICSLMLNNN